jgi:hypothetical protein
MTNSKIGASKREIRTAVSNKHDTAQEPFKTALERTTIKKALNNSDQFIISIILDQNYYATDD